MRDTTGVRRNRKAMVLAILLALVVGLAGCGGATSAVIDTPASSTTTAATEMPASTVATSEASTSAAPSVEPSSDPEIEPIDIRIGGLTGPTSMGLVQVMEAAEAGTAANRYAFTIAGSADELTPKLVQGELDMAALPANLASVLYNNTSGSIRLLAVNTLGVVYLVEKGDSVQSFADIKGKTIFATGKGSSPEYALRYLLTQNGMDPDKDVTIEWKAEPAEVVALLAKAEGGIAMMPQPYVTIAQGQVEGLRIAVNLTQVWDALENGSTMVTGVLVVRSEFAEQYPEQIAAFLEEYRRSTEFVNANIPDAAALIEKFGIFKAAVASKAIPFCNITFLEGDAMKAAMEGYLGVLFGQNPKSVGGKLPGEDFYYLR